MSRLAAIALFGILAACATAPTKPAAAPNPTQVVAVGATYQIPPFLAVHDIDDKPGATNFDFDDNVTRCSGHAIFETVGNAKDHDDYVKDKLLSVVEDTWKKDGATFTPSQSTVPMLGASARVTSYVVKKGDDTTGSAIVDHHFADQVLSIVFAFDCPEPGVISKELENLARVVDSQKKQ